MARRQATSIDPSDIGFVALEDGDHLHYKNVGFLRNEVSPFCLAKTRFRFLGEGICVDPFYGLAYETGCELPLCAYGSTKDLPPYNGEAPTELGFLRVPFRRIPRRRVRNRKEFDQFVGSIKSADPNLVVLYRGQDREFFLNRSEVAAEHLYGDPRAQEPSLLPSAARFGVNLEEIGGEWSAAVQLFIHKWVHKLVNVNQIPEQVFRSIATQLESTVGGHNLWAFLLSLAQHYGLPSAGLDLTDRPQVALYFALTRLIRKEPGSIVMRSERVGPEASPVIYLFSCAKSTVMDFKDYRPHGFPIGRPDRQSAMFWHTSWGYSSNSIATRLWVALYLDPAGEWGELPSDEQLFPGYSDDPFADYLATIRTRSASDQFHRFMERFYMVSSS